MNQDVDRSKTKERYAAGKMRQHSTRALFFIGGFGAASWAPLIPLLRERLAIGEDVLGMMLLCIGIAFLAHQTSLYAAFGLLAFLVALQALIAAYVYKKVL